MVQFKEKKFISKYFFQRVSSILEVSNIRFQKILHIAQLAFFALVLSLIVAPLYNYIIFPLNKEEDYWKIFTKLSIEVCILVILLYYVRKITLILPFLFQYSKDYDPEHKSSDGESLIGNTIAMAIVFATVQTKLKDKVKYLTNIN